MLNCLNPAKAGQVIDLFDNKICLMRANLIKNKYATSLIAKYKLGLLDSQTVASIPRNTRYYWDKNFNAAHYLGFELESISDYQLAVMQLMAKNKSYLQLCKNLFVLYSCYQTILSSLPRHKSILRKHKLLIISTYSYLTRSACKSISARVLGLSVQQINRWKDNSKCSKSPLNKCRLRHPLQLSVTELSILNKFLCHIDFIHLPLSYRWAQLVRVSTLKTSLSTFYKYSLPSFSMAKALLGEISLKKYSSVAESISFKADAPFQYLHMDSTVVKIADGSRVYVHFIMDNFSKYILSAHVSYSAKSAQVAQNLKSVLEKHNLSSSKILCDDGPENNGEVNRLLGNLSVEKIIATYKYNSSNNLIEAFNKKFKQFILFGVRFESIDSFAQALPDLVYVYNNLYQPSLGTRSPKEVLNGVVLPKMDLVQAREKRLEENRLGCCGVG